VSPHSTAQLLVQQYRERSPSPYVGMKEKLEIVRKLYEMNCQFLPLAP